MTPPIAPAAPRLPDRRDFLTYFSSIGLGSTLLPGVLWGKVSAGAEITTATIAAAEEIAGVSFSEDEREMMVRNLRNTKEAIESLHKVPLDNSIAPVLVFDPVPPGRSLPEKTPAPAAPTRTPVMARPDALDELAFLPVTALAAMVRARRVKPSELTEMYLARLKRFDPRLHCVITLTEERARAQARAADAEIARGEYRGPLHGIPWGAKDLLAVRGYKTTWGAGPYKEQVIDADAAVVQRLDAAGAILVAKLTLGELAQGDVWYGETTRNPWWPEQGSSGSSAGPGSATAAGLVGFSIGTETLGSISSPSTRNGVTGLRPTFGRVPRTGAMALSWSMDKIGPMCRSAEDCALVLAAIAGPDGQDLSVKAYPFNWNAERPLTSLRIGYVKSAFDRPERDPENPERTIHPTKSQDDDALAALRALGAQLVPVDLPDAPIGSGLILQPEAGAAFEELVLTGRDALLVQQHAGAWPNTFRAAHFVPAVDYINANRARLLLMRAWWDLFTNLDVIVVPTGGTNQLVATNLTGNPSVIVPHGFREAPPVRRRGEAADSAAAAAPRPQTPVSLTFLGPLFQEEHPLRVAHAFQQVTDFHRRRPPGF